MGAALAQTPAGDARPARPTPPTRDPNTQGYVAAKELPDGTVPPPTADGNFVIANFATDAIERMTRNGHSETLFTQIEGKPGAAMIRSG